MIHDTIHDTDKQAKFRNIVQKYIKPPKEFPDSINIILNSFFEFEPLKNTTKVIQDLFENDQLIKMLYEAWSEMDETNRQCIILKYACNRYTPLQGQ